MTRLRFQSASGKKYNIEASRRKNISTRFKSPPEKVSITALIAKPVVSPFKSDLNLYRDMIKAKLYY